MRVIVGEERNIRSFHVLVAHFTDLRKNFRRPESFLRTCLSSGLHLSSIDCINKNVARLIPRK